MSVILDPVARSKFNQYKADIARINSVESVVESFAVQPVPEQKIIQAYQDSDDFLKRINIFPVLNQQGQKIGMNVGTSIASTTDTRVQPRRPTAVGSLENLDEYLCTQTNYDVAYYWGLINAWRHHPDFKSRLAMMVTRAVALDKITIGFNGVFRSPTSDRNNNPLLQDVKRGWLQRIRDVAPEQAYSGTTSSGSDFKITVGSTGEFKTLDGLIENAIDTFIAPQHQNSKDLVAIVGRGIVSEKYLPMLDSIQDPTEQIAARAIYANRILGTLPTVTPPQFPENTILITSLDNLSIYMQSGTMVRSIVTQPEWDRDVDFQSVNEDFVVEDYTKAVLLQNIEVA